MMLAFLLPLAAAMLVVAVDTAVLVRRDRRWMADGADTVRIEAAAPRDERDTPPGAQVCQSRFPREPE
ncbi:hypothetical protein [Streptomyces sp. NPDC004376]